jgi:integrase/recombinase XerD
MLRFAEYLELQDFRHTTKCNYYRVIRVMSDHFGKDPALLDEEEIRRFFVHVRCERGWAPKSTRQFVAGSKHFYRGVLGQECLILNDIKSKDRETLPTILTIDEIRRILTHVRFQRYRMPLLLIFASGLRVGECLHLTVDDIDGPGNRLFVRDGKGGKDRYTILSTPVYHELRAYWKQHCNAKWLFPAVGRGVSVSSVARERMGATAEPMHSHGLSCRLLEAARAAGVTKRVTCHILRHSFATHLAAAGVPLHQIQAYLGHAHIETTMVYAHLTPINHEQAIELIDALIKPVLRR